MNYAEQFRGLSYRLSATMHIAYVWAQDSPTTKRSKAVASHSGPLGLQTLLGVHADRKFPVLIIHGDQDKLFPVDWARENRDKYTREGHEVKYVEVRGLGHMWGTKADVHETIWEVFADHPRGTP